MDYISTLKSIFSKSIKQRASDLHLISKQVPIIRIDGKLMPLVGESVISDETCEALVSLTLKPEQVKILKHQKEIDFSFNFDGSRIRANIYFEQGRVAGSFRFIPAKVLRVDELGLPPIVHEFANLEKGLLIVTGPTGQGKSTTIASLIEYINQNFSRHIVTIEDPVEYLFHSGKSIISQREYGTDTMSFERALKSALREDADVVFVGEMRDLATFDAVLTIAEAGHLVFTTLHTNEASQTPSRIVDAFPKNQQIQVRQQLANVLAGIVSQRLVHKAAGQGRLPACEIMVANAAIRNLIREGKDHQIQSVIQTSANEGMISLDQVLADYVAKGQVTLEEALLWASDPRQFKQMVF
jgi:twitching motility protein PilT